MDQEETLEISDKDVSTFTETLTPKTDMSSGTNATMAETRDGTLTERDTTTQPTHSRTELSSKLDQEWPLTEPCSGTSTLVTTNTDSESDLTIQ